MISQSLDKRVPNEYGFLVSPDSIKNTIPTIEQKQSLRTKKQEFEFLKLLANTTPWPQLKKSQFSKIKKLCRAGVPESLRAQVWCKMAQCSSLREEALYHDLLNNRPTLPIYDVIERDINRCFPDHVMFRAADGAGQANLRSVLRAYAQYNPDVEYCQGMGFLVGMMLMHMQPEDSFWLLVATIHYYADGFYNPALSQIKIDAAVFGLLLQKKAGRIARKMEVLDVPPLLYITQWFITFFTGPLPWESALRVWDIFYFDGIKAFFRVALGILKACQPQILKCPGTTELLDFILHIPHSLLTPERLLNVTLKIGLTHTLVDRVRKEVADGGEKAIE